MPNLYVVTPENTQPSTRKQAINLAIEFSQQCRFRPLPYMAEEMARYLQDGFAPDMISEAIARTARAPRPSFAYLAAIMRNAKAEGKFDYQSFAQPKKVSAQMYSQREYTPEFWEQWQLENDREMLEAYYDKQDTGNR